MRNDKEKGKKEELEQIVSEVLELHFSSFSADTPPSSEKERMVYPLKDF